MISHLRLCSQSSNCKEFSFQKGKKFTRCAFFENNGMHGISLALTTSKLDLSSASHWARAHLKKVQSSCWQLNSFTSHLSATWQPHISKRREMRGMPKSEPAAAADEDKLAISAYIYTRWLVCVCVDKCWSEHQHLIGAMFFISCRPKPNSE